MAKKKADLLQGTLDLLILKTLSLESRHGLGISRRIQQITRGTFEESHRRKPEELGFNVRDCAVAVHFKTIS